MEEICMHRIILTAASVIALTLGTALAQTATSPSSTGKTPSTLDGSMDCNNGSPTAAVPSTDGAPSTTTGNSAGTTAGSGTSSGSTAMTDCGPNGTSGSSTLQPGSASPGVTTTPSGTTSPSGTSR
jgi:hypothetical protein